MKTNLIFLFLLLLCSSTIMAQSSGSGDEKDPFKNSPFFSKPVEEILRGSDTQNEADNSSDKDRYHQYFQSVYKEGIDIGGAIEAGPYNSGPLYSVYPGLPMIHYNRVDGVFLGVRKERMQWHNNDEFLGIPGINPHGLLGYSFGQNDWQYVLGLEKYIGRKQHIILGAEFHKATATDDYWRTGLIENSLTSYFAGYDHLDYFQQKGFGAYLLFRTERLFEGGIAYSADRYSSLQQTTDWALFGAGNRFRPNPPVDFMNGSPVDTLNLSSFTLSASFNPKELLLNKYFTFSLTGVMEVGDSGWSSSDYDFTRYQAEIKSYYNFEKGGLLSHRLKIGSITGQAPLFKQYRLGGIGSLRALPYKSLPVASGIPSGGNQMILSNLEVQFGHPSWGSQGWIDFDELYISIFLDSGWTQYDSRLEQNGSSPFFAFKEFSFAEMKHNAGIGAGTNSVRVELAWDLDNTSRAPVLWIRLNPTF